MRRLFAIFTVLLAVGFTSGCVVNVKTVSPGAVAKDGSVYLGFDLVSSKGFKKDFTNVSEEHGKFSKVRLHVDNAPVRIKRITLTFGNGDKFNVKVKKVFKRGQWSRWVDLPGGKRHIRKIVVVAAKANKKRARMPKLEYYARR
jgi:hypothetical protein